MKVRIERCRLNGQVQVPASKSELHRMLIAAALAKGESRIANADVFGDDIEATAACLKALGAKIRFENGTAYVNGGLTKKEQVSLNARESGSTLRFLLPVLLASNVENASFYGSKRLMERCAGFYENVLKNCIFEADNASREASEGADINHSVKYAVKGSLEAGEYEVPGNVSSQYISGLLFALPLLRKDSTLRVIPPVESRPYIRLTMHILKRFGIQITEESENLFRIPGNQKYIACDCTPDGDWSEGAALYTFSAFGHKTEPVGLNPESMQGDRKCLELIRILKEDPEPVIDLSDTPDLGPVLFALAAVLHGGLFTGVKRLRIKESDRLLSMQEELKKFGIRTEIGEDSFRVYPGTMKKPEEAVSSHHDHRIVMAMTLLLTLTGGTILDAECVKKSDPEWFVRLRKAGLVYTEEED